MSSGELVSAEQPQSRLVMVMVMKMIIMAMSKKMIKDEWSGFHLVLGAR